MEIHPGTSPSCVYHPQVVPFEILFIAPKITSLLGIPTEIINKLLFI